MTAAQQRGQSAPGFRSDIQGLRAVAVLAVLAYHCGLPFVGGGYVGVDVFFVISGFLITSHLVTALDRDGRIDLPRFYARRARRLLPAAFVVLGASVIGALIWYPPLLMREVWLGAVATAAYVPNYLFAVQGTDYLAETTPSLFQHYWSLGIEEQFYLVWPLLLLLTWRWLGRARALFVLVTVLVVGSFAAGLVLTGESQPWAFFSLPTRAWELGVGGLLAIAVMRGRGALRGALGVLVGWAGIAAIGASIVAYSSSTPFPGAAALLPVLGAAAVILSGSTSPSPGSVGSILALRPLQTIGTLSYAIYLVHWPMLILVDAAVGFEDALPLWASVLVGCASVPVAWVLHRLVEEPGRRARWLVSARPRRTLFAAAAGSIALAVLATGVSAASSARPLDAGVSAPAASIDETPDATGVVPDNLEPSLAEASSDQPVLYDDGCHLDFAETEPRDCVFGDPDAPRIALFGDSHAAQWFPALLGYAQEHGFAVQTYTKSSCPSILADVERDGAPYDECSAWRLSVLDDIAATDPALVVLSNFGEVDFVEPGDDSELWGEALGGTLEAIDAPAVVLADTPNLGATPAVCLSANLDDTASCDASRGDALDAPSRVPDEVVTEQEGDLYVDLTDYLCGSSTCAPILGDLLVYRDGHHLTATFSAALADALDAELPPDEIQQ